MMLAVLLLNGQIFSCWALALALSFLLLFIVLPVSVRLPLDLSLCPFLPLPVPFYLSLIFYLSLLHLTHHPSSFKRKEASVSVYPFEKRALHNPSHLQWILSFSLPYKLVVYFSVFRMIAVIFLQRLRYL